ncbi:carbohydrate kinase [Parapedobacter pyrenivorans]|uniref:Carbohydrate kinase n=1 Tax=Parapedobacter pyrenivorans TaxID=1305674 RepID=A0A917MD70_9SPHI|nr:FGGY-family carbohydrate kinase [Parapedobacter pyrenivorans]GGG89688.1 carbohydrate kinase [Parapedobacter pyrenivorans]
MESYLLGIDCGNTVCKATLFSLTGRSVGTASGRVKARLPKPGYYEYDLNELWMGVSGVIRAAIQAAGVASSAILAVGVCGHGNGLYGLDGDGKPLVGIQSLDFRAEGICQRWNDDGVSAAAFLFSRQYCWPGQTNSLLAWLRRYDLPTYMCLRTVFFCKDYLNYCLTGVVSTDYSDLSVTNLMAIEDRKLNTELFDLFGLSGIETALPEPRQSKTVIGRTTAAASRQTGLPEGIPVVAGMIDLVANMVGCGSIQPGSATVISGSWSVNCLLSDAQIQAEELAMVSLFADPTLQIAMEASPTAMTNLEWFVNQFMNRAKKKCNRKGTSVFAYCDQRLADRGRVDSDVLFLPFLHGNNLNGIIRSGFYNLSGSHTKDDMLQAVYEGIAFSHLAHVQRLRSTGKGVHSARFTGGGARSPVFSQLLSSVLQTRLECVHVAETGCLGAAIAAAVGIELYPDYHAACGQMVAAGEAYIPDEAMVVYYRSKFHAYTAFVESMIK